MAAEEKSTNRYTSRKVEVDGITLYDSDARFRANFLKKHLKKGETAIAYVPGHYIACVAYKNGKYLMLESAYGKKRGTTPYGDWVTASRLKSGTMKSKNFFVFKATD